MITKCQLSSLVADILIIIICLRRLSLFSGDNFIQATIHFTKCCEDTQNILDMDWLRGKFWRVWRPVDGDGVIIQYLDRNGK